MKLKRVVSITLLTLSFLVLLMVASGSALNAAVTSRLDEATGIPSSPAVLVELFTSEGCSTCPPADRLLSDLDQTQPIEGVQVIALSEHVDYWNQLGWTDPFSSAEFSRRQSDYALAFGRKDLFTPEMVVDGRTALIGSRVKLVLEAIANAAHSPKAEVTVVIKASGPKSIRLTVQVESVPDVSRGDNADVMLAISESGLLSSVSRGENSGRELAHSAVTRKLIKLGTVAGRTFNGERVIDLSSTWKRQHMKAVAFVQEHASRRVLGAAAIKLETSY